MGQDFITIIMQIVGVLISVVAVFISLVSMRQSKDSKNADQIRTIEDRLAFHEKEDAAAISTIKARLHSHRALLRFLHALPERMRVLEYIAKVHHSKELDEPTLDDEQEDNL
jgi:hypothetical protein